MRKGVRNYVEKPPPSENHEDYASWDVIKDMKPFGIIVEMLDISQLQYVKGASSAF